MLSGAKRSRNISRKTRSPWAVHVNDYLEGENYTITTLNENTLVLEYRESYEGGDYYEKNTFERVN